MVQYQLKLRTTDPFITFDVKELLKEYMASIPPGYMFHYPTVKSSSTLPKTQVDLRDDHTGKILGSIVNLNDNLDDGEDKSDPVGKPMGADMTPEEKERYCGTKVDNTANEPKPTLFQCPPCGGAGGFPTGLCGGCKGKGLVDARRLAEIKYAIAQAKMNRNVYIDGL